MNGSRLLFKITGCVLLSLALSLEAFAGPPLASRPFSLEDFKAQVPQDSTGSFLLEIPQILNTAADQEVRAVVAGCSVETSGQIMSEGNFAHDGKRLRVARSQIQCCAAHAREYSVVLAFSEKAPALQEKAWVRLRGTLFFERQGEGFIAAILVNEWQQTAQPQNPLLR
ncbi:MAG: hypothetical protein EBS01_05915 [Verrucomicrobia bacterium]|nr:hypothetical protein [Verrucomicrobiota bacterium]